ncbi:MAG: hypothetical protein AAGF11_45125 [Myxococcota bacterium]
MCQLPHRYTRLPVLDVPGAVSLGIALVAAADASLPTAVQDAATQVREGVVQLQARWAEQRQAQSQSSEDPRPVDARLDRAWSAVGRRLEALVPLPLSQAEQASTLYSALFPTGLSFLTLAFEKQWAESEQRLQQIDAQGLADGLNELVGSYVLDEVRAAHEAYGQVLGLTEAKPAEAPQTTVVEALRTLRDAMTVYCLQLVAAAYAQPSTAAQVRSALRPVDDRRAAQARRSPSPDPPSDPSPDPSPDPPQAPSPASSEVSPTTPVPELE